jgi:hypothetical protein
MELAEAAWRVKKQQQKMKKRLRDPGQRDGLPLMIFEPGSEKVDGDGDSSSFGGGSTGVKRER